MTGHQAPGEPFPDMAMRPEAPLRHHGLPAITPVFSHVDILTGDLDAATTYYRTAFDARVSPPTEWRRGDFHVSSAIVFLGCQRIILVKPHSGWLLDLLATQGEGTVYRLAYVLTGVRALYHQLTSNGLVPVNENLEPLAEADLQSPAGMDVLWLPPRHGPSMEFLEKGPAEEHFERAYLRACQSHV